MTHLPLHRRRVYTASSRVPDMRKFVNYLFNNDNDNARRLELTAVADQPDYNTAKQKFSR